jgi:ribosomal protein S27AE
MSSKDMFSGIIEKEIEWCEQNIGFAPNEFRAGFIAGLKQSVYIINAIKQGGVWHDGEMVVGDKQKCPSCENGIIWDAEFDKWFLCPACNGTGNT